MTDKDKATLALQIIASNLRRLTTDEVVVLADSGESLGTAVLGLPLAPYDGLHLAEGDFAWRGEVSSGPLKGQPFKVDPQDVKDAAVKMLLSVLEDGCLFARKPSKAVPP